MSAMSLPRVAETTSSRVLSGESSGKMVTARGRGRGGPRRSLSLGEGVSGGLSTVTYLGFCPPTFPPSECALGLRGRDWHRASCQL